MGIMRLGHVRLKVMSIEEAVNHYVNVLGLIITHRDDDGTIYLKGWDEWDKYSIVLIPSDGAGAQDIAFKVENANDLTVLKARILDYGIAVEDVEEGNLPFCGPAIRFCLPSGHVTYLYAHKEFVGKSVGSIDPDPWPDGLKGIGVHWLDHAMLICELDAERGVNKVAENTAFMTQVLDFHLGEQICLGPDGDLQIATWLFRTTTPHDIAFGGGDGMGIHHVSFYMDEWHDVLRAADILAKNDVRVEITPQRHGITRGPTTYFFDPSGNRNEVFAGLGYLTQPDMPTITWTEENIGRGVFYHQGSFEAEFLTAYT